MNRTLTLRNHWSPAVGALSLFESGGEDLATEQSGQDLSMQSGTVLTTEGLTLPWVPSVIQIKRHLRLEAEDAEDNEILVMYRDSAAAMLLNEIGQDAEITDYVGEADYEGEYKWIRIDRSNIQSVSEVKEKDSDGNETVINASDYTVRYKNKIVYLEGKFNEKLDKDMVAVSYRRGFIPESAESKMLLQVMLDTIHTLYLTRGRLTEMTLRRSPAFNAAMALLRDRRSTLKYTSF